MLVKPEPGHSRSTQESDAPSTGDTPPSCQKTDTALMANSLQAAPEADTSRTASGLQATAQADAGIALRNLPILTKPQP